MRGCQLSVVSCQLLVAGQWSVVSCHWLFGDRRFQGTVRPRTDRFQVAVEFGTEFIAERLKPRDVLLGQKAPAVGPTKPMFGLIQRAPRRSHEAPVVCVASAAYTFCDVRSD